MTSVDDTPEPSTRLVLHALAQILIEKGVMSREELQQRVDMLRAADEGELPGVDVEG